MKSLCDELYSAHHNAGLNSAGSSDAHFLIAFIHLYANTMLNRRNLCDVPISVAFGEEKKDNLTIPAGWLDGLIFQIVCEVAMILANTVGWF